MAVSQPLFLQHRPGRHERAFGVGQSTRFPMPWHFQGGKEKEKEPTFKATTQNRKPPAISAVTVCSAQPLVSQPRGSPGLKMLKEIALDSRSALSSAASCPNRKQLSMFSPGPAMASGWADSRLGCSLHPFSACSHCWKESPLASESLYALFLVTSALGQCQWPGLPSGSVGRNMAVLPGTPLQTG